MITENLNDTLKSSFDPSAGMTANKEGKLTKTVEHQTAKAPSITWLGFAVGSMAVSAGLQLFTEKKELANFIGMWAPSFLMIGIYNKIVKVQGSDRTESSARSYGFH